MEESSEKRRERLRTMRMEAAAEAASNSLSLSSPLTMPSTLSNPLLETPETTSSTPSRFGFYTDPMAAFSSDKRPPQPQQQPHITPRPHFPPSPSGPHNPEMPVPGVHQFQNSYRPYQGMHQGGVPYYSPGPATSPMGIRSPYSVHQGSPNFTSGPSRGPWFNNNPNLGSGRGGSPYPMHQGSPNFRSPSPGRGQWLNNSPSPSFGRGSSPSPSIGRGSGRWDGGRPSPGPRYSGGRGRGSDGGGIGARSFYHKSMVEDPWESLTPIIWRGSDSARVFSKYRGSTQKTPSAKKPKFSGSVISSSKQSLAEFLSASFNDADEDATAG